MLSDNVQGALPEERYGHRFEKTMDPHRVLRRNFLPTTSEMLFTIPAVPSPDQSGKLERFQNV